MKAPRAGLHRRGASKVFPVPRHRYARGKITLLEHRASLMTEGRASKDWSRQAQVPSIERDGAPYDRHLDRLLTDLPLDGVRSTASLRS